MNFSTHPEPVRFEDGDNFKSVEFNPPIRGADTVEKDTFEIGLVLAGAVSAGAYIAGVMDFLIEALDAWQAAKERDESGVPNHRVLLKVISGASGGGMNGAIAAAVLGREFPHVRSGETGENTGNPFFDAWVNDIDISLLLTLEDLAGDDPEIVSILDSTELDNIARRSLTPQPNSKTKKRNYVANPLRLLLTVTNLRGVPYWMTIRGNTGQGHGMLMHRDHLRFALKGMSGPKMEDPFPDETSLSSPANMSTESWSKLATASLATGAIPPFLKPRDIKRRLADYDYRNVFEKLPPSTPKYRAAQPSGSGQQDNAYDFLAVDGGTMNNEPLELARRVLAGAFGRNPRGGNEAKRATVMIDPFPEMPDTGPENGAGINPITSSIALASAWKSESRFRAQDLALAGDDDVYSRFLVAPSRRNADQISRGARLTSEALGAFGGFLSRHYRVHDFLLGRRNCQRFLSHYFVLPQDNELFNGWKAQDIREPYLVEGPGGTKDHLPIIPLVKRERVAEEEPMPAWPTGLYDRASIEPLLDQRFDGLYEAAMSKLDIGWFKKLYLKPLKSAVRKKLRKFARDRIAKDLDDMNL